MRLPILNSIISKFGKKKSAPPLVSPQADVHLLRRVHGRRFPRLRQVANIGKILSTSERRLFRFCLLVFIFSLGWVGVNVAQRYRVQLPANGGRYVEAVVGSVKLVNPIFALVNDVDTDVSHLVFSGLMRYDQDERLLPDLAVRYTVSEDKKVYTFELKKDVVWHDSEPFTAHDIAYTIETIQNPNVGSPLLLSFQGVKVEVVDDYTIKFTLAEPFAPFLSALTVGILPEHRWSSTTPENMRLAQLNTQPIGTGPFLFKKLVKDDAGRISEYNLSRFDRFYRHPAYIEEFVFRFYDEYEGDSGAVQALREQIVDGLSFVPYETHESLVRKHIRLHTMQLPQYSAVFINMGSQAFLEDLDARNALAAAIDKDRIVRESLHSEGEVIEGPILPGSPGYSTDLPKIAYSADAANALLDKKWPRILADDYRSARRDALLKDWIGERLTTTSTTSTVSVEERAAKLEEIDLSLKNELHEAQTFYRKEKDGNIVSISLVTADTPEYQQAAALLAGFWQDIGVRTAIKFVPPKDFSRDALRGRKYDVLLYSVIVGSDPDQYPFWHSSQVDYPGLNLSRYINRSVDTLLEKIRGSASETDIATQSAALQTQLLKDRPAIFLYSPTYTYAASDKVQGINVTSVYNPADRFSGVTEWYMKTDGAWKWRH